MLNQQYVLKFGDVVVSEITREEAKRLVREFPEIADNNPAAEDLKFKYPKTPRVYPKWIGQIEALKMIRDGVRPNPAHRTGNLLNRRYIKRISKGVYELTQKGHDYIDRVESGFVSMPEYIVAMAIKNNSGISARELMETTDYPNQTIYPLTRRLERKGLIKIVKSSFDEKCINSKVDSEDEMNRRRNKYYWLGD